MPSVAFCVCGGQQYRTLSTANTKLVGFEKLPLWLMMVLRWIRGRVNPGDRFADPTDYVLQRALRTGSATRQIALH